MRNEPRSYKSNTCSIKTALKHFEWVLAMKEDLASHLKSMHIVGEFEWIFKTKLKFDGTLDRLKAWLVAKGFNQSLPLILLKLSLQLLNLSPLELSSLLRLFMIETSVNLMLKMPSSMVDLPNTSSWTNLIGLEIYITLIMLAIPIMTDRK